METNNLIGEYTFKVLPFEVDFRGKLTMPHLTNYILNTAGYHAESSGFGIEEINKENKSWVLSRLAIEMIKYPHHYDKIQVQTWVESVMRTFSFRNFAFLTKEGEVLGYARSVWAMIDITSRRPNNLSEVIHPEFISDKICPIAKASKIASVDTGITDSFTIKYSDIDLNQHLNSAKYVEHIIDSFTLYKFERRDIKRFEVEYIAESTFGEKINIYKKENPNNEFLIELRDGKDNTICKSKIIFGDQILHDDYNMNK